MFRRKNRAIDSETPIIQPFSKEQEKRLTEIIDKAFENNRQRTRVTCWFCDRAIDESKGYSTWLGVNLHTDCSETFKDKMRPAIAQLRDSHSNLLWEGFPVFTIVPKDIPKKEKAEPKITVNGKVL